MVLSGDGLDGRDPEQDVPGKKWQFKKIRNNILQSWVGAVLTALRKQSVLTWAFKRSNAHALVKSCSGMVSKSNGEKKETTCWVSMIRFAVVEEDRFPRILKLFVSAKQ